MMANASSLTIGKLAEATGVNLETVRYYERIGLMPRPARTAGGYRSYEPNHLRRLNFIRRSRELGFTLDDIRGLLRLVDGHRYTCVQVHEITVRHAGDIRQKIADLRRLERVLIAMASECKGGHVPSCPIIDELFKTPAAVADRRRRPRRHRSSARTA
jgi:MerR family transcriptional regulator, mercuric resistance operon regulatory protein